MPGATLGAVVVALAFPSVLPFAGTLGAAVEVGEHANLHGTVRPEFYHEEPW